MKLRDFWIAFSGDPKHDQDAVQIRTIYLKPLKPLPGEDIVHVREVPEGQEEEEVING